MSTGNSGSDAQGSRYTHAEDTRFLGHQVVCLDPSGVTCKTHVSWDIQFSGKRGVFFNLSLLYPSLGIVKVSFTGCNVLTRYNVFTGCNVSTGCHVLTRCSMLAGSLCVHWMQRVQWIMYPLDATCLLHATCFPEAICSGDATCWLDATCWPDHCVWTFGDWLQSTTCGQYSELASKVDTDLRASLLLKHTSRCVWIQILDMNALTWMA